MTMTEVASKTSVRDSLIGTPETVWITGASSGIGKETAIAYAKRGATVLASARSNDKLLALAAIKGLSGRIIPCPVDVTDNQSILDFIEAQITSDRLPTLAILNAGYYEPYDLDQLTIEHFEKINDINYLGVVRCLCALLPHFKSRGSGHISVTASAAGYAGLPRASAYGSSKAALINMCESLKPEMEQRNLRISVINPGFVKTPMTDKNLFSMPFLLSPEQAAQRIVKGLDSSAFDITFPRRFNWTLKLLGIMPYRLFFFFTKRLL